MDFWKDTDSLIKMSLYFSVLLHDYIWAVFEIDINQILECMHIRIRAMH